MFLNARYFALETTLDSTNFLTEYKHTLKFTMVESCSLFTDFTESSEVVEALTDEVSVAFVTLQLMTKLVFEA